MTRRKKPTASLVRSSAAEYLTFVAAGGTDGVEAVYANENVWLSQKMMAQLYDVEVPTINYHLKKVFEDSELEEGAVIRNFRITAADGKTYETKHYNLSAIIAMVVMKLGSALRMTKADEPYAIAYDLLHTAALLLGYEGLDGTQKHNLIFWRTEYQQMLMDPGWNSLENWNQRDRPLEQRRKLAEQLKAEGNDAFQISLVLNVTEGHVKKLLKGDAKRPRRQR